MKKCSQCKEEKGEKEFSRDKFRKSGRRAYCKTCGNLSRKAYYYFRGGKEVSKVYSQSPKCLAYEQFPRRIERKIANGKLYHQTPRGKANTNAKDARRRVAKIRATPPWSTDAMKKEIFELYLEAQRLTRETGIQHHVDHIIPLQGKNISGLHVPDNMQVMLGSENCSKSNKYEV